MLPSILTDLVGFVRDKFTTSSLASPELLQTQRIAPFKAIHSSKATSNPNDPLKAFVIACVVLRGHTNDYPLPLGEQFKSSLERASHDIGHKKSATASKGKAKTSAPFRQIVGSSKHIDALDQLRAELRRHTGDSTLPYLDKQDWRNTKKQGASQRLQIGWRDKTLVSAFFNPSRGTSEQLIM